MSETRPPVDLRCQIYAEGRGAELFRCSNEGTHWEQWGGEDDDFHSWECDGEHDIPAVIPC